MGKVNIFVVFVISQITLGLLVEAVLRLDNEPELREAQAAIFNINSRSGWLVLNYVGPNTVHFSAGGEGTADEVVPQLEDDQIQYIIIREAVPNSIRDVFITWIGPEVSIIEKGKKTAHHGDAQAFLQPFHSSVTALSRNNFNDETIIDRSHPLSGSHVID